MKTLFTTLISCSLLAAPTFANNFDSQHRVGLGFSKTKINEYFTDSTVDWGKGIKLEYGYEFNRLVGLNVAYTKNKDSESNYGVSSDIDGFNIKIDADIGYKFYLENLNIKPYGLIGLAHHNEENSLSWDGGKLNETYKDTSIVIGLGARAEFGAHIYTDMRVDYAIYDDADYDTFSWTIGYRF
ncbi:porin family protein [Vibrio algarum]|uniref:Porin family protein n=1 Tax=Vibrio algarum TaxID=3020714 RepID=A0ABT4YWK0_9VIBR|nr:porin family protein [Vibrio sp. KJ40-1]MDB1125960.1 porin family protein [Vibrio sp. KJ40-1]